MPLDEFKPPASHGTIPKTHEFEQETVLYTGSVAKVLNEGDYVEIKYYPHDDTLKASLADWYHDHGEGGSWLSEGNFILGNVSQSHYH